MKESGDFHLLKLVFKALYSAAWPSYLKINELVQVERMTAFKIMLHGFFNLVLLFILKIAPFLITSVMRHTLYFKIIFSNNPGCVPVK